MDGRLGLVIIIGALFAIAGVADFIHAYVQRRGAPGWLERLAGRVTNAAWYTALVLFMVLLLQWIVRAMGLLPPPRP